MISLAAQQTAGQSVVNEIVFAAGAPAYTFQFNFPAPKAPALTIAGQGVLNNSGNTQNFVIASSAVEYTQPQLKFTKSASAGTVGLVYTVGPTTPTSAGGGVLGFYDQSTAGSATFIITTGAGTPPQQSTVGGEVAFSDSSSAGTARFIVYGSTSTTDGDTFANAVFHNQSTAANAEFTNVGGTVSGGDGGNTQFYDTATAASGVFHNQGGTVSKANGGDVAFDGTATAGQGTFHNTAATASGGYGGVTSFNNNYPYMAVDQGANAGNGGFYNYGAKASGQGGGHTFFTSKYGSATAANGTFFNYGSAVAGSQSWAGHTVFSISLPQTKANYFPSAGQARIWNFPGTAKGASGGYTQFTVYTNDTATTSKPKKAVPAVSPTAANATIINLGGVVSGAYGGSTQFSGNATAGSALLIAMGGSSGGGGGQIVFYDQSTGGTATVRLSGNGVLDISDHDAPGLTIGNLELSGGTISVTVGSGTTCLILSGKLSLNGGPTAFLFKSGTGFQSGTAYVVLTASNLSSFNVGQFTGNSLNGLVPHFAINGNNLQVTFA